MILNRIAPLPAAENESSSSDDSHPAHKGIATRISDLAYDVERSVIDDFNTDLRVLQIVRLERRDDQLLDIIKRAFNHEKVADKRERYPARAVDLEFARQVFMAKHGDAQLVAGSKRILVALADRGTRPQ